MSERDGGTAFPVLTQYPNSHVSGSGGMSLRDYFAGQALGLFSLDAEEVEKLRVGERPRHDIVAGFCYDLADAMLAAREES